MYGAPPSGYTLTTQPDGMSPKASAFPTTVLPQHQSITSRYVPYEINGAPSSHPVSGVAPYGYPSQTPIVPRQSGAYSSVPLPPHVNQQSVGNPANSSSNDGFTVVSLTSDSKALL
jgi:hypothetical protein